MSQNWYNKEQACSGHHMLFSIRSTSLKNWYYIFPILAGTCFGSAGIFVRELSLYMDSITIISSRVIVAVLILAVWMATSHRSALHIHRQDWWVFTGAGLLGTLGLNLSYNFSINKLTLSLSAVLLCLAPIFVMILALIFFGEKITPRKILSMILAFSGCVLTSGILEVHSGLRWSAIGIAVGSTGAIFYALYSIFSKKGMQRGYPALTITFYSMVCIAIVLLPVSSWDHVASFALQNPARNIPFLLGHSLFTAVCPYVFYTVALEHMDAGIASILCSCEPAAAMVFGIFFFHEIPTILSFTGMVIILLALALLALPQTARQRQRLQNPSHSYKI